jgi:PBP1b-binding outer membrane lipoprotein LpoB
MTKIRIIATLLAIMMLASLIMGCQDNTQPVAEALPTFEELVAINGYDEVFKNHATIYLKNTCIDSDPSESFVQEAVLMPGDGKVEYHMTATNLETNTVVRELSRIGDEWYYYDIDEGIWAILEVGNSVILDISTPRLFEDAAPMGKAYVDGDYVVHHAYTIYEAWEDIDALRYDYTYYFNKDTYLLEKVEIKYYDGDHELTKTENVEFKYDVNVSDVFESTLLDRMHAAENRIDVEIIADYNTDNEKKYNIVATTDSLLYAAVLNDVTYVVYSDPECQNEILDLSVYEGLKSVTVYASKLTFDDEVRYTVTQEEWNAWTTHKNFTIEQSWDGYTVINKYTEEALQMEDGNIVLFLGDKQYQLLETESGYVAYDVTVLEFANNGLLSGGFLLPEASY